MNKKILLVLLCLICTAMKPVPRIFQGTAVSAPSYKSDYPWMMFLVQNSILSARPIETNWAEFDVAEAFQCAATLIHPRYLLTAAHCVKDSSDNELDPSALTVIFDRLALSQGNFQSRQIRAIHRHPQNDNDLHFDVALIELADEIPSSIAAPVLLAPQNFYDRPILEKDSPVFALGWGWTEPYDPISRPAPSLADELQKVDLVVGDKAECGAEYNWSTNPQSSDWINAICTTSPARNKMLPGDSGGPLLARMTANNLPQVTQVGVVSSGDPRGNVNFTQFSQVSNFVPWIESHLCSQEGELSSAIPQFTIERAGNKIKLEIKAVPRATFYRVFYRNQASLEQISSLDLGPNLTFEVDLPADSQLHFDVAIKAYHNNCSSSFSSIKSI